MVIEWVYIAQRIELVYKSTACLPELISIGLKNVMSVEKAEQCSEYPSNYQNCKRLLVWGSILCVGLCAGASNKHCRRWWIMTHKASSHYVFCQTLIRCLDDFWQQFDVRCWCEFAGDRLVTKTAGLFFPACCVPCTYTSAWLARRSNAFLVSRLIGAKHWQNCSYSYTNLVHLDPGLGLQLAVMMEASLLGYVWAHSHMGKVLMT